MCECVRVRVGGGRDGTHLRRVLAASLLSRVPLLALLRSTFTTASNGFTAVLAPITTSTSPPVPAAAAAESMMP
jgi:hypothetical protein